MCGLVRGSKGRLSCIGEGFGNKICGRTSVATLQSASTRHRAPKSRHRRLGLRDYGCGIQAADNPHSMPKLRRRS